MGSLPYFDRLPQMALAASAEPSLLAAKAFQVDPLEGSELVASIFARCGVALSVGLSVRTI